MIIPTPFTKNSRRYYLRLEWTLAKPRLPKAPVDLKGLHQTALDLGLTQKDLDDLGKEHESRECEPTALAIQTEDIERAAQRRKGGLV